MKALIQTQHGGLAISLAQEAHKLKEEALASAALVGKVKSEVDNQRAVEAQAKIKSVVAAIEKARRDAKAPFLDAGRDIDAMAKSFRTDLDEELMRVARLVGDYQALLLAKRRAEEAARQKELLEIERQRQEERAKAKSLEELDKTDAKYNAVSQALAPPPPPPRPKGQVVKEDWAIEVTDKWQLARCHPFCVDIVPRLSEIRKLLDAGQKVNGVSAKKEVKATVRTQAERIVEV